MSSLPTLVEYLGEAGADWLEENMVTHVGQQSIQVMYESRSSGTCLVRSLLPVTAVFQTKWGLGFKAIDTDEWNEAVEWYYRPLEGPAGKWNPPDAKTFLLDRCLKAADGDAYPVGHALVKYARRFVPTKLRQ
jgi:hypothetical protein